MNPSLHTSSVPAPKTTTRAYRVGELFLLLSVAVAAVLPYLNALPNDFVWDDRPLILHDPSIRSPRNISALFLRDFFAFSENQIKYGYYRPLISLSYMADWLLWGKRPWGFRLTNLVFHAACSVLVVVLARRLKIGGPWAAWLAGLLFALHPVHTESVTWVAGRTDVWATFFLLASFALYLRAREAPVESGARWAPALFAWGASALCKETALVFALFIFLYERLLRGEPLRAALRRAAPFVIATIVYILWRSGGTRAQWNPPGFVAPASLAAGILKTLWRYAVLLVWPASLSAYIQNPLPQDLVDPQMWGGLLLVAGCAWIYARFRARTPMAWLVPAFLASLLPVMNFIRISAPVDMGFPMAERFLYFPSVFFCIGAAALIEHGVSVPLLRWTLAAALAVAWSGRIAVRNTDWRDEETFFKTCLREAPDAPLLHAALGARYLETGRHDEAISELKRAFQLNLEQTSIESAFLLNNLAAAYRAAGRYSEALAALDKIPPSFAYAAVYYNRAACFAALGRSIEAERAYRAALDLDNLHVESWIGLGELLSAQHRWLDAAECYRRAAELFPDQAALFNGLGVALKNAGRTDEAIAAFERAIRLDPSDYQAHGNLGVAWAIKGNTAVAEQELRAALALNPRHWDAWNALGALYGVQRRFREADECFDAVLAAVPDQVEALLNKGILRYQEGAASEAEQIFQRVLSRDPGNARAQSYLRQLRTRPQS